MEANRAPPAALVSGRDAAEILGAKEHLAPVRLDEGARRAAKALRVESGRARQAVLQDAVRRRRRVAFPPALQQATSPEPEAGQGAAADEREIRAPRVRRASEQPLAAQADEQLPE